MTFSPDGNYLYYPVNEHGVSNLVKQSVDGGDRCSGDELR